jgi:cell division protein FtsB
MTSPTTPVAEPKAKTNHRLLAGGAIFLGVVLVAVLLFSHRGIYQIYRFRQDRVRLDQENARLAADNTRLTRTIDRLQHDPEMIQEFIRRELNFVKKNEIIFQLPPGREHKSSIAPAPPSAAPPEKPPAKPEASPTADRTAWVWRFLEGAPKSSPNAQ